MGRRAHVSFKEMNVGREVYCELGFGVFRRVAALDSPPNRGED